MLYMADAYMGKAHVTADQIGDYNAGVSGSGCVLNVGEKLRADFIDIIDFTVVADDIFVIFKCANHGLTAAGDIADAQARVG